MASCLLGGFGYQGFSVEADDGLLRPGGANGWWHSAAAERKAADVEVSCVRAEATGAIAIAHELAGVRNYEAALRCLALAREHHPEDRRLVINRARILRLLDRLSEAKTELAQLGLKPAELSALLADLDPIVNQKAARRIADSSPTQPAGSSPDPYDAGVVFDGPEDSPSDESQPAPDTPEHGEPKAKEKDGDPDEPAGPPLPGHAHQPAEEPGHPPASHGSAEHDKHGSHAGESHGHAKHENDEEHEKDEEREEPQRFGAGYLHAAKNAATLTDWTLHADHRSASYEVGGTLHALHAKDDEGTDHDTLLDGHAAYEWRHDTTLGLLLGYAASDGKVSYKSLLGARYRQAFAHEAFIAGEIRRVHYFDGSDWRLAAAGGLPPLAAVEGLMLTGQLDLALGQHFGNGLRVQLGYEHGAWEGAGFVARGRGLPSHAYLRPEDDEAFTTIGADLGWSLTKEWLLSFGAEQRRQDSGTELEVSFAVARAY